MLDLFADAGGEDVEDDLADDEEEDSEGNVAQRPAILQRVEDEEDLHDQVDQDADSVDEVENHKQAGRVRGPEAGPALERHERDGERDDEHAERRQAQ